MANVSERYLWTQDCMLEISLNHPEDFLKIRETLTRIGMPSKDNKSLTQTAHILHKRQKYYIVHFLEMFALDGNESTLTTDDIKRRNEIAKKLQSWKLLNIINKDTIEFDDTIKLHIIPFKEKSNWTLIQKYSMGITK